MAGKEDVAKTCILRNEPELVSRKYASIQLNRRGLELFGSHFQSGSFGVKKLAMTWCFRLRGWVCLRLWCWSVIPLSETIMKIAIASDHAGFRYKVLVAAHLRSAGYEVVDFGTDSEVPVDYPDFIRPAAESVANGKTDLGIVLGGSGNGEAIVANKVRGIRCAVCWNENSARLGKQHNNANVISFGERMVSEEEAIRIVDSWLHAEFEGGRHLRRIEKIEGGGA